MMCYRNNKPEKQEVAAMDDGIDLKKVHAAMHRDPERMYHYLNILMNEARMVRDDPAFVIPGEDDSEEADDLEDSGVFMKAAPAADRQEDDLRQDLDAMKNGEMSREEESDFIYKLCEAIVAEGRPQRRSSLPFPVTTMEPAAAVKPKARASRKKQ